MVIGPPAARHVWLTACPWPCGQATRDGLPEFIAEELLPRGPSLICGLCLPDLRERRKADLTEVLPAEGLVETAAERLATSSSTSPGAAPPRDDALAPGHAAVLRPKRYCMSSAVRRFVPPSTRKAGAAAAMLVAFYPGPATQAEALGAP